MAFNQNYYDERKKDLEDMFNKSKARSFQQIVNIVGAWNEEAADLQKKFQEINQRQAQETQEASQKNDVVEGSKKK